MGGVKTALFAATAAAGVASAAITKVMHDALNAAAGFKQFEAETGASAQELQRWQSVAEQSGQSAQSVTDAIKSITDNQAKMRLGQGNRSGYELLGIDPNQDPFEIIEKLRNATANMSAAQRKDAISRIGVNASMLQVLSLTKEKFDAMANNGFIISPGAIKSLSNTKSALDLAARSIKWLKAQIAVALAPQIRKLTQDITKFIKVHKQGFIEGFQKAFTFVSRFVTMISRVASMVNKFVMSTIGWKNALIALVAVFALSKMSLLTSPLGRIILGFVALAAIMEDIYVYSKGGDSLFGVFKEKFPELAGIMESGFYAVKDVLDLIVALISGDKLKADAILDSWNEFGDIVKGIMYSIKSAAQIYRNFIKGRNLLWGVDNPTTEEDESSDEWKEKNPAAIDEALAKGYDTVRQSQIDRKKDKVMTPLQEYRYDIQTLAIPNSTSFGVWEKSEHNSQNTQITIDTIIAEKETVAEVVINLSDTEAQIGDN